MYYYESLGDERFQEFCQALISAVFPDAQCLPTGQPDGGRDAYLFHHLQLQSIEKRKKELIVFQVKFVRNASDTRTHAEFIEEVVKKEKAKIERLKQSGLRKYYLLTNLKGSSHLGVGSIDTVNRQLSELLSLEAHCWWRDDLDRRTDGHSAIKWSYPDILKATDLLEALIKGSIGEEETRRRGALRAYMIAQYDDDQELKFKQADLRSTMTDLFVDLPMRPSTGDADRDSSWRIYHGRATRISDSYPAYGYSRDVHSSAEFFVKTDSAKAPSRAILEGAPGQGKSTVTQYVCQVMRMKLLDKRSDLDQLPKQFKNIPVRIPFRVDLRDLAKWISGIDPFQSKAVGLESKEPRSLEGFLAGQVRFASGGHDFSVADLTAIARGSHLFLALDGFDEVADIDSRQQLVAEITKGTTRLMSAGGFSVQTVVTSRPAAFAKSIRFPREQWSYYELLPLERRQVDDYTAKWMKAKGLKEVERNQLRRVLDAKLKEAHTQYLAKNPMQLTILLSLIYSRGASLPEKRTAMYDAYMDMFFSRESEKSDIVRDYRDLLIDIHRFLAWKLQTAAEAGESGSIEHSALRSTLFSYLDSQDEDTAIVNALFDGIVERVGAVVSRVQETYEFEVQPLREYFAARYLYETSPYSPPGDEKPGTKLERFDALVKNPYWLNVTRFYGGCFSKGEISALVDRLSELATTGPYMLTSHPRSVALTLLGDWVFTQYQPAVKRVVALVAEQPRVRQLLANGDHVDSFSWPVLPDRSGRAEFVEICWRHVIASRDRSERRALARAIAGNASVEDRLTRWLSVHSAFEEYEWAQLGEALQVYSAQSIEQVQAKGLWQAGIVRVLLEQGRFDCLPVDQIDSAKNILFDGARNVIVRGGKADAGWIASLATICSTFQYMVAFMEDGGLLLGESIRRRVPDALGPVQVTGGSTVGERRIVAAYKEFMDTPVGSLRATLEPWKKLVEALRGEWGDRASFDRIAFIAAGVRSKEVLGVESRLDRALSLVEAARYIRLKAGAPRWWERKLRSEMDPVERRRLLLLLWLWGSTVTFVKLAPVISEILGLLNEKEWEWLNREHQQINMSYFRGESTASFSDAEFSKLAKLTSRASMFIGVRLSLKAQFGIAEQIAKNPLEKGAPQIHFAMEAVLREVRQSGDWKRVLPLVQSLYARGGNASPGMQGDDTKMPNAIATEILTDPAKYPLAVLQTADSRLRVVEGSKAAKLLDIATRERWFQ